MQKMIRTALFTLSVLLLVACTNQKPEDFDFQLPFEISGGSRTATYDETMAFCHAIDEASPQVHYESYGKSSLGYELPLLIIDKDGFSNPSAIQKSGRTLLLVQANI